MLLSIDCSGAHEILELQNETVSLSPESCVLNGMLQPSAFLCEDREGSGKVWAMHPWALVMDEYDHHYLAVSALEGYVSGLTPCYHGDRFVVLVEACLRPDCKQSVPTDDVIEFTFDHPIGKRAVECMSKPKLAFVSAGRAAAAAVGGGVSASLGSSAAGGSGGGAMAMIGVVQFMALLADNCGTQTDVALQDFVAMLTPLQTFNLRFPMPDVAIFNPFREWRFTVDISLFGM
jgi:hypothetical protein